MLCHGLKFEVIFGPQHHLLISSVILIGILTALDILPGMASISMAGEHCVPRRSHLRDPGGRVPVASLQIELSDSTSCTASSWSALSMLRDGQRVLPEPLYMHMSQQPMKDFFCPGARPSAAVKFSFQLQARIWHLQGYKASVPSSINGGTAVLPSWDRAALLERCLHRT